MTATRWSSWSLPATSVLIISESGWRQLSRLKRWLARLSQRYQAAMHLSPLCKFTKPSSSCCARLSNWRCVSTTELTRLSDWLAQLEKSTIGMLSARSAQMIPSISGSSVCHPLMMSAWESWLTRSCPSTFKYRLQRLCYSWVLIFCTKEMTRCQTRKYSKKSWVAPCYPSKSILTRSFGFKLV